ncbi:TPA: hypothetical protein N0F65_009111 [Lagenidium giganteum]|uniref:Reverse transcriptase domain-containing protein n=1 Tax=Lagenidium giganteum TaxID=4803 RepID=A0AAV2YRC5_9STRA|nr:TPA: hypothetical protein N0F65_009111 [Lagenidium giganteum]
MGFPPRWLRMLSTLHMNTRARFVVNHELSSWRDLKGGIRQGCPTAPYLFICVLEALHWAIERHADWTGVEVPSLDHRLRSDRYVDDTALYVANDAEQQVAELPNFSKSVALNRHPQVPEVETQICFLREGEPTRYLGVQVGLNVDEATRWAIYYGQLATRLAMATKIRRKFLNERDWLAQSLFQNSRTYCATTGPVEAQWTKSRDSSTALCGAVESTEADERVYGRLVYTNGVTPSKERSPPLTPTLSLPRDRDGRRQWFDSPETNKR